MKPLFASKFLVAKIISGGQTGADRGGLDAAIELGIPHGGWCPKGRRAEDGTIPNGYMLEEHDSVEYPPRTKLNIESATATAIFTYRIPEFRSGTAMTKRHAVRCGKPVELWLLSTEHLPAETVVSVQNFIRIHCSNGVLNVAGSRESSAPGLQSAVCALLVKALNS